MNEIATTNSREVITLEDSAMSVDKLVHQVQLIQHVMKSVMKENEHYGVIPGTQKPTLLKPGAEKLCLVFRLDPNYEILDSIREEKFISYTIRCTLIHIPTSNIIAQGIGSCNSRETKYRYRSQNTGRSVPSKYWDTRDSSILGGPQFTTRKKDGHWVIYEQVENINPWDYDNTLMKMACKRALVAATLNATAASDLFTQDVEDMPQNEDPSPPPPKKETDRPKTNGNGKKPTHSSENTPNNTSQKEMINAEMKRKLEAACLYAADFHPQKAVDYYHLWCDDIEDGKVVKKQKSINELSLKQAHYFWGQRIKPVYEKENWDISVALCEYDEWLKQKNKGGE